MTSPFRPNKYQGTDVKLTPFVTRDREPTGADYRQPETGRLYPLGCVWQVGKNPTTGVEGELWMLSKIVANVAFWVIVSGGSAGPLLNVEVDSFTAPGTDPVLPDGFGTVTISGGQVASGTIGANVIETHSRAANEFNVEIQQSGAISAKDTTLNGVAHFNDTQFTVDEGFVSLLGGGQAIDEVLVQAVTAPGVNPVTPDINGQITVNGALVSAHSVPIESHTRALNEYNIEAQVASAVGATDVSQNGMAHFDSANFTVDPFGFVSASGTGLIQTLTPDEDFDGSAPTPVAPQAGTINVLGSTLAAATVTETYNSTGLSTGNLEIEHRAWLTPFVVDASTTPGERGTFSTIQAAITAASSPAKVAIRAGTYTENITLKAGVDLVAFSGDGNTPTVTIIGNLTHNTAGTVTISGIRLQTNSGNFLTVSGSAASIVNLKDCFLNCDNNTGISYTSSSSSSSINFFDCQGNIATTGITFITSSGAGVVQLRNTLIGNTGASTTASTFSAGFLLIRDSEVRFAITTSGTCEIQANLSIFNCFTANVICLTHGGTTSSAVINSTFTSDTNNCLSVSTSITVSGSTFLTNTGTVVSGAGTFIYAACSFYNNNGITATTTTGQFQRPGRMILRTSAGTIGTTPANELSIYEEGTFTPTVTGATTAGVTTYSVQAGYYTRIGNLVTCNGRMTISAATGTGNARFGGLPFTIKNQADGTPTCTLVIAAGWALPAGCTQSSLIGTINSTNAIGSCSGTAAFGNLQMQNIATTFVYTLTYQI